jgi:hypothetical protein
VTGRAAVEKLTTLAVDAAQNGNAPVIEHEKKLVRYVERLEAILRGAQLNEALNEASKLLA